MLRRGFGAVANVNAVDPVRAREISMQCSRATGSSLVSKFECGIGDREED